MKRIHAPQFTQTSWFPAFLKRCVNEFLTWFVNKVGAAKPFMPIIEEGLGHTSNQTIINLDLGAGAGIETLKPYLVENIEIDSRKPENFSTDKAGLYTFINNFHSLTPENARQYLEKISQKGHPIAIVEGNNNNWWQAIGMLVFVPLSVLLTAPIIRPFRIERLIFTYLIPILPIIISLDGAAALFKLYGPKDLDELVSTVPTSDYQWRSGKLDNGRGGKIMYLIGYSTEKLSGG